MIPSRHCLTLGRFALTAAVVLPLASCGDHSPTQAREDGGISLQVVISSPALPATAPVGTTLPPVQVRVLNKRTGRAILNEPVNFVVIAGGGSVFAPTVQTDIVSGIALDLWTLGTRAGFDTLQARVVDTSLVGPLAGSASIVTFAIKATPLAASVIGAQAGSGQTAVAGSALPSSPAVLVTDRFGNPISGVTVTFAVSAGGGSVAGASQPTNASGIATVGSWTLGTTAGPNTLTATAAGLTGSPVTFTATGINASANQLIPATSTVFTGTGVTGTIPAATGPAVRVVDANNNGVPNVAVTFTVTGPACPSCSLYPGTSPSAPAKIAGVGSITTLTDANGRASGGDWTLSTLAGANALQATAVGLAGSPVVFTATGTAGAAALLFKKAGDGQSGSVGTALPTQPAVSVTDVYGNPFPSGTAVTFTVQSGGGGVPTAPSVTVTTDLSGTASVSWTLGSLAGPNALTATAMSHTVTFTATATGPAGLNITNYRGDGQNQPSGTTLPIAPAVQLTDLGGHPVTGVQVAFNVTAGGGSIAGATQVTDVNGIATVGAWTLGPTPGVNELKASFNTGVSRGSTIFVATGRLGNLWTSRASMPTPRYGLSAATINGILYAVGGLTSRAGGVLATVEAYDPGTNTWTTRASMPTPRGYLSVAAINGILYAVGGSGTTDISVGLTTVEAYNPATDTWTTKASMSTPRTLFAVGVVGGTLYAVGGSNGNAGMEAYDPAADRWTPRAPSPEPRYYLGADTVSGVLYAVGGCPCPTAIVDAYTAATNTWTTKMPMPTPRQNLGVAAVNGILYAIGGWEFSGNVATVEAYDPASDAWTTKAPMLTVRSSSGVSVIGGIVYVVGGADNSLTAMSTVDAYRP